MILEFVSGSGSRRQYFKQGFHDFLSEELQSYGIKCWLKCKCNYISKIEKKKHHFWRGSYFCLDKRCKNNFVAKIYFEDSSHNIGIKSYDKFTFCINSESKINMKIVMFQGNFNHDQKIIKPIVCSGKKRNDQAREILMKSVSIVQNQNFLNNLIHLNINGKKTKKS